MRTKPTLDVCADLSVDLKSGAFHKTLLDNLFDGVYFVDHERTIRYWNGGAERLSGYAAEEAVGKRCYDNFLCHMDEKGAVLCKAECPLMKSMETGQTQEAEVSMRNRAGERVFICVRVAPMSDSSGQIIGAMEVFAEATARTRIESRVRQLEQLAFVDELTNLPNRRFVEVRLRQTLELLREFNRAAGVLMIDIDWFKRVNDTYGHDAGDATLRLVAHTLKRGVRTVDVVGRWGGEEFLVILSDVNADMLHLIGERCRNAVAEAVLSSQEQRYQITASIGATLLDEKDFPESVIKRADGFLYKSKTAGRNRTTVG
ncbi:MAG TPA: GGDEF domain-containing protein [Terriglobales bacterium]|nr:GGDEF domain-containing protein [Terriglobales bacterium]